MAESTLESRARALGAKLDGQRGAFVWMHLLAFAREERARKLEEMAAREGSTLARNWLLKEAAAERSGDGR